MAFRGAEITTRRKEKGEKEKVRTITQQIIEKSFILTLSKPTTAYQASAAKTQPHITS